MGWTSLFLEMENKNVLIVGSGEVGTRRTRRFLEAGANVIVIGNHVPDDLLNLGAITKTLKDIERWVDWADIVVTASGDHVLNEKIAAISGEKLLNRADYPDKGNLIVPSSFFIGDVQISIFTNGKSPLMSKELRKKIEKVIKLEDILQLELQSFAREILKKKVDQQVVRKNYLYSILEDEQIQKLLKEGRIDDAKIYVNTMIASY